MQSLYFSFLQIFVSLFLTFFFFFLRDDNFVAFFDISCVYHLLLFQKRTCNGYEKSLDSNFRKLSEEVPAGTETPGGGGKVRLTQRCHHQNDFCIETGSDESHYVPLIVRSKVTKPCTQTTTFEEGGEPKRNWTEVLLSAHNPYSVRPEPAHTMPLSASSVLLYVHRDRTDYLSLCIQPNLLTVKLKTEIPSPPQWVKQFTPNKPPLVNCFTLSVSAPPLQVLVRLARCFDTRLTARCFPFRVTMHDTEIKSSFYVLAPMAARRERGVAENKNRWDGLLCLCLNGRIVRLSAWERERERETASPTDADFNEWVWHAHSLAVSVVFYK